MLRSRQTSTRLWIYTCLGFVAGLLFSLFITPKTKPTWEERTTVREQYQQSLLGDRKKLLAIVGVQTGFNRVGTPKAYNYRLRRDALRQTWFPNSQQAADELESDTGMLFRFVIGHSEDAKQEAEMLAEIAANGAFLRLPVTEAYLSLTKKTLVFLQQVTQQYDADYIVKVDDDVFLRVDRVPLAIAQWKEAKADYVGCMKTGSVFHDPKLRWYEPQHALIGGSTYFTHAWGSIYVLSRHAATTLAHISAAVPQGLRFFNNEDVTVGGWMLAMNVSHLDDRRLCEEHCGPASVAVYDIPQCAGLCDAPKSLPLLHASPECRTPNLDPQSLPSLQPYFRFQDP